MPFTNIGSGRIEYERIACGDSGAPTFVMLHEGLGSVAMWRDFPGQLARATRSNVVVYSRHGYGRSAPLHAPRAVDYMHDEALVALPQFLDALGIENPVLFGHSDGGSIALIHAGGSGRQVAGIVVLAPHVFVEDLSIASIAAAKVAYATTSLRERLARYHDDVDGVFRSWNDIWLHPEFRSWNIEAYLPRITCPVLAIQGDDDEYGSREQIQRIERAAAAVEWLSLANCRHSPHRDQPEQVLAALTHWLEQRLAGGVARDPTPAPVGDHA
jgi:pimeloyl-ACP methyl ester carboxylesterase